MAYADKIGVPYTAFLGEDEVRQGAVSVKDMASGQQITVPVDEAVASIRSAIEDRTQNVKPIEEPQG